MHPGRALPDLLEAGLLIKEAAPGGKSGGSYRTAELPEDAPKNG